VSEHPYLYLDGIVMKRTWAGGVRNVSLLVASAVNSEGFREILGICEGAKEDKSGWSAFLRHLVDRGLTGVQLIISDACRGPDQCVRKIWTPPLAALAERPSQTCALFLAIFR
jgi:transposase-like protein